MKTHNEIAGRKCECSGPMVRAPGGSSRSPKRWDMDLNKHFDFSYTVDTTCWGSNIKAGKNSTK